MQDSASHSIHITYMYETVVFLLAAVTIIPIFRRIHASPVLGYLFGGALIGPYGFGVIDDVAGVQSFAELGIVFLMFMIGLELSFERLRALSRYVFGLGGAQVSITALVIGGIAWAWGNTAEAAILIGASLALSSTAIVIQLLDERGEIASRSGRIAFAILLLQDLAVVPLLVLLGLFAGDQQEAMWLVVGRAVLEAVIAVVVIIVLGRFLVRRLFQMVAWTHSPELFVAMTLLAILGTSMATGAAGLSMALGAFLAGLLVAETEFRHQIETDIEPFKGLLLGLFFISVGMGIDFAAVLDQLFWLTLAVFGLIAIKAGILTVLAKMFGIPTGRAIRVGLLLGEGGEFAFVVVGSAMTLGVIAEDVGQFMLITAGLSMVLTPFLDMLGRYISIRMEPVAGRDEAHMKGSDSRLQGHVVVCGFGRSGQAVGRMLDSQHVPYLALEQDAARARDQSQKGRPARFGDTTRLEVLRAAGVDRASAVVLTINDSEIALKTATILRQNWPNLPVFVRAKSRAHIPEFQALGIDCVVPAALESSLTLAGQVLRMLGVSSESIHLHIQHIRQDQYAGFTDFIPEFNPVVTEADTKPKKMAEKPDDGV